ncbi:phenylacetate-coenzyme A ligase [Spirochaetia bacterium]|nr:phenylacetate-coenzyme A ligase [Spirochaetia bacterium]
MTYQYWDEAVETMPREELCSLQVKRLKEIATAALRTSFYRNRLSDAGIRSADDIKSLDDLRRFPFTTKYDLRDAFPFGFLSVPQEEIIRLHASSGTTGAPTTIYLNAADLDRWSTFVARCIYGTGCTKADVFQNMITYGLFTGGLGFQSGAEKVGMMTIPSGPGNVGRQFRLMRDFGTTIVHATPSFLLHVQSKMEEEGFTRKDIKLKRAFAGAEPYSEDTRKRIEALLQIDVFNSYGISEMNGPGVAFECQCKNGLHIWEDGYIVEIVNPETLEPVPDGELGELVLTCLCRESSPILRYRTRDLTSFYTEPCECGRTHRRLHRFAGRTDDMLIINGVNLFPSQIEEVIMGIPEVGNNYLIVVEKEGLLDRLTVKTEVGPAIFMDDSRPLNALKERIRKKLQALITINPRVELHERGALPVQEGKAKRVQDSRPKNL